MTAHVHLPKGSRVADRYRIEERLGSGGMGAVYAAFDDKFMTRVALKVSPRGPHEARFQREALIGNLLGRERGFVRATDWGFSANGSYLYLAMDLVPGAVPLDLTSGSTDQKVQRLTRAAELRDELHNPGNAGTIDIIECDLASLASVRKAADTYLANWQRLDVLINNAGIMPRGFQRSVDGFELTFATNHRQP